MTHCVSDSLDQFYPVDGFQVVFTLRGQYFDLVERHRHRSGRWGQCRVFRCENLTLEELLDVLDAIGVSLRLPGHPSEPRSR